ncbi:MAG: hypothetical protein Q7K65_05155 [Candidatus Buchananbacteria bacterium]|nr:hypothetical protein [Candidatus Buchananbacteria bacterium]
MTFFRKILIFSLVASFFASISAVLAINLPEQATQVIPEQAGVYDVLGHPDLKLKVFVHEPRIDQPAKNNAGKPIPQTIEEVCTSTSTADPDSISVVSSAGWKMPAHWIYRLNLTSIPSTVGSANLPAITSDAFDEWSNAINNLVTIERGSDTTLNKAQLDGQNIIAWGRTSGRALAVSYVWYNSTTGELIEVDTIMNSKFTWYWSNPNNWPIGQTCAFSGVYDAQNILTHELGHTVGLDDEYDNSYLSNTMYGYGAKGETKKNTLTVGDKSGALILY